MLGIVVFKRFVYTMHQQLSECRLVKQIGNLLDIGKTLNRFTHFHLYSADKF